MTKIAPIIASLVACFTYASAGDTIASRSFPSCSYVGRQIYCWGGDTSPIFNSKTTLDEEIYSLDINAFAGQRSDIMISQWNKVVPEITFWIGQRGTPTSIVLSDGKRFMIQGGDNTGAFKYINQTIIYDTSTNKWEKGSPYSVENVGVRQIFSSTAVNLPNGLIGFYGGFEQYANTSFPDISGNGDTVTFDNKNLSYVGFSCFTTHNVDSGTWSPFSPQASTLLDFYPTSQTATINPKTGKIYYLGGSYYTTTSNWIPINIPFSWAAVFDTRTGTWSNETLTGNIPGTRMYHTANLLPNSQDIILYGGSEDGQTASGSYCYTLNLETNTWTNHDKIDVPTYLSGPRFSHSAVLVDTILFILFGRGADGALNPSLLTIDVKNATNILYTANYASNATTNLTPNSNQSGGLSKGAIGGIAAGSIVAGLGIIAFIFFFLRRQKKENKANKTSKGDRENKANKPDRQEDVHYSMGVDWDKIEEHYKEVPTVKSNFPKSPEIIENANVHHYSPSWTETTAVNNNAFYHSADINPGFGADVVKPSVSLIDGCVVKPDAK